MTYTEPNLNEVVFTDGISAILEFAKEGHSLRTYAHTV